MVPVPTIIPKIEDAERLLSGKRWQQSVVTYSFPNSADEYESGYSTLNEPNTDFSSLPVTAQDVLWRAFEHLSSVTGLVFEETQTIQSGAHIAIAGSTSLSTAWAYQPQERLQAGGDIWFRINWDPLDPLRTPTAVDDVYGDFSWGVVLHEMLHAMGLKHGHEADFGVAALPRQVDGQEYTLTTYRSYVGDPTAGFYSIYPGSYPATLMSLDIAALQQNYGANYEFRSGDTLYQIDPENGAFLVDGWHDPISAPDIVFRTLWDGGGQDHLDLASHERAVSIDLRPGGAVDLDVGGNALRAQLAQGIYSPFHISMSLLYDDNPESLIENATGGSGDDRLIGNVAGNILRGGLGLDTLTGLDGADVFAGVRAQLAGDMITDFETDDILEVSEAISALSIGATPSALELDLGKGDAVTLAGLDSTQTLAYRLAQRSTEVILAAPSAVALSQNSDRYRAATEIALFVDGQWGDDVITGGAMDDLLVGGEGSDQLLGLAGADTLIGGPGNDVLVGGAGRDLFVVKLDITSQAFNVDILGDFDARDDSVVIVVDPSETAPDVIDLPGGAALAITDTNLIVFEGYTVEQVQEFLASDAIRFDLELPIWGLLTASPDMTLTGADETLILETSLNVNAGSGADIIIGASESDRLAGGDGSDELIGGAGQDILDGGAGSDILTGGADRDVFVIRPETAEGFQADFITDFDVSSDIVKFEGFGFTSADDLVFAASDAGAALALGETSFLIFEDLTPLQLSESQAFEFAA